MPMAELGDISIHYKRRGDGPPLLGIMGFSLDQRYWAGQIPAVTKTHSFITFDNRGVGRSTGGESASIDEMADDAIRLLDHLEIERCVVMGVSMGGAIAQRLVVDNPGRVSALILGITWARPIEFMRRQHQIGRLITRAGGARALLESSMIRMLTPRFFEIGQESVDQIMDALINDPRAQPPSEEVLLAQIEALDKHDVLEDLARVSVPTLVFGAKMDVMVPAFASEEIAATIPGATLKLFETGHGCMIEELEAVNAEISAFLATLV